MKQNDDIIIENCENLEKLNLMSYHFKKTDLQLLSQFRKLNELILIDIEDTKNFDFLYCLHELRSLKLKYVASVFDTPTPINLQKDLNAVEHLDLWDVDLGSSINHFPNLKSLKCLSRTPLNLSREFLHLEYVHFLQIDNIDLTCLNFFPKLNKLEFEHCRLSTLDFLIYTPNLTELVITKGTFTEAVNSAFDDLKIRRRLSLLKKISFISVNNLHFPDKLIKFLKSQGVVVEISEKLVRKLL
jgi:hypothetical protein